MNKRKLFTKYNRINVIVTLLIFVVATVAFYFTLSYVQARQIDGDLMIEEQEIQLYVKKYQELPKTFSVDDQIIQFTPVKGPYTKRYFLSKDLNNEKGELEDFRQLVFGVKAGVNWYKATVSKSLRDTDHLIQSVLWVTFCTILLILLSSIIINRFVLKKLWKPFYSTLAILGEFKIDKEQTLSFPATTTEEFANMIDILERTTSQAKHDYLSLKTFSENASHELQTPIAIIQSKLDLLMQDHELTEQQSERVQIISDSIKRLKRLNNSLLLLTKIENRQFSNTTKIDLKKKAEDKLADFKELWQIKLISVTSKLQEISILMNSELVDVLMNNLLSNATRYNYEGGSIMIELYRNRLTISNTSTEPQLDKDLLFQRFYKPFQTKNSNGLGLSIIKQICDTSGIAIQYQYLDSIHSYTLVWSDEFLVSTKKRDDRLAPI